MKLPKSDCDVQTMGCGSIVYGNWNRCNFLGTITIGDAGANTYLPLSTNTGTTGYVFTSTGTNSSSFQAPVTAGAQYAYDAASRATTSASYVDIGAALSVTATTGTLVQVSISTYVINSLVNGGGYLSFAVSGATTIAASQKYGLFQQKTTINNASQTSGTWVVPVTAGSNTFTLKFATFTGTSTFYDNHISIVPLN